MSGQLGEMEDPSAPLHIHVLSFLTPEERNEIPDGIRTKVAVCFEEMTRKIHNHINQKQKDRIANEGQIRSLEAQLKEIRDGAASTNDQLNKERKTSEEYVEKYRSSLSIINQLELKLQNVQASLNDASLKLETITAEKEGLVSILDRRLKEIEELNNEKKNLADQLHSTTGAKIEALFKVDEFTSKKIDLDYREKELDKEREWVNKQVQLLNIELDRKNSQIVDMQREHTTQLFTTQADLAQKGEELRQCELSLLNAKALNANQEAQIERLLQKLRESQEMELKIEENYRVELQSQSKIANLYKEGSDESQKKIKELESAVSNLQGLLSVATERYGELETTYKVSAKSYQEEVASRDERLSTLEMELKQANDLLKDLHEKGLTEEMIENLSPAAAAVCNLLRGTHSLTEIYSKLTSAQEELLLVNSENARLREDLTNIVNDIAARGPLVKAQKEDYARSLETIDALTSQLELAMESEAKMRDDYSFTRKTLSSLERENGRLKTQITDNSNQIKVLMREIESLRGTYVYEADETAEDTSGILDSSHLITKSLVTFRNIDELQSQNAYLLSLVRELSDEREKAAESADSRQVDEIKAAYEEVRVELEELKEMRIRQDSILTSVREQHILSSPIKSKSPRTGGFGEISDTLPVSTVTEAKYTQLESSYKELKEEFDTYKTEMGVNEKIASEQMERLRDDLTRLRTDNVKLSSQVEYNNERSKIYSSNLETYKKTIASLEEKNKQMSVTVAKHEQTSQLIRNELLSNQEKLARAEVALSTLTTDRNSLRDSKSRLQAELDLYKREERTCKILELNLAEIKNNLELASSSAKLKLEAELESLKKENVLLRRKTEGEGEQLKSHFTSWDKVTKELELKAQQAVEGHENAKAELLQAETTVRSQRIEIEKLLGQVQVLTGNGNAAATLQTLQCLQTEREEQTREFSAKILTLEREATSAKQQIALLKSSVEEYKTLAKSLEEQIGASNDTLVEDKLRYKDDIIRELQCRLDGIERESHQLKSEKEALTTELAQKSQVLGVEMSRMERELQVANSKFLTTSEENVTLKEDLDKQTSLTREFQAKYDNELGLHSSVVENRNEIRNELDSVRAQLGSLSREKILVEEELKELKTGNEGRDIGLHNEIQQLKDSVEELETLNTSLQEQLMTLTAQLEGRRQMDMSGAGGDLDVSFSSATDISFAEDEEKNRTTEHWVQLLRYMRRQKEIAYSKVEMSESTVARLQSQLTFGERQYKELEEKYNQLQSSSQTSLITSSKTAELLRKIETLSALTDSNRLLREDRENLSRQLEELKLKAATTEAKLEPLTARLADVEGNVETLTSENTSLKQDIGRWRARANALIDKSNKFNPEEMKKVTAEKDTLTKQLNATEEIRKKLYGENVRLDSGLKITQGQVTQLQGSLKTATEQNRKLTDDMKRVNDYKTGLATELEKVQKELVELKKNLEGKSTELEASEKQVKKLMEEVDKQKAMVRQVKNIARRYKQSYVDAQSEGETPGADGIGGAPASSSTASGSDQPPPPTPQVVELETRVTELSTQNETLQKELEDLRQETVSRDEQAKLALKTMRDKVASINQQKSEQDSELTSTRTKLSTIEASSEEANIRLAALKSQYEARLSRLEIENKELRTSGQGGSSTGAGAGTSELATENETLKKETEMQKQRILVLEKQLVLKTGAVAGGSGTAKSATAPGDKTHSTDPPKANIKPIAGGPASGPKGATTQVVPPSTSRPQPTASIRPMSMTRKATVMPTTAATPPPPQQQQQQQQPPAVQGSSTLLVSAPAAPAPVSQAQVSTSTPDQSGEAGAHHPQQVVVTVTSSAPTGTLVTNSTNVRQATVQPTQAVSLVPITTPSGSAAAGASVSGGTQGPPTESTASASGHAQQEPPSTSTSSHLDSEMGDSSEQVSSSEPSSHQPVLPVAPIRSGQEVEESSSVQPASSQEAEGGVTVGQEEPSPSTSSSRPTQSSKRSREDEVETSEEAPPREEPDSKRTRLIPQSSEISMDREAEARGHRGHAQEHAGRDGAGSEEDDEPQVPHSGRTRALPTSHQAEEDDDKDSDVVVIESSDEEDEERRHHQQGMDEEDEEEMGDDEEGEGDQEDEGEDEEVEAEEAVEEYEDIGDEDEDDGDEDIEIIHQEDAEEGREAESIEEIDEESMEEGEDEDEAESAHGMLEEGENVQHEESSQQDVILLDREDDYEVDMNQEAGEASPVNPNGSDDVMVGQNDLSPILIPLLRPQGRQVPQRGERSATYPPQQSQQLPLTPSYHMYAGDEPDDRIVPSTPTLYVPRRTDGFAEAVSSPHVSSIGRQFVFGAGDESRVDYNQYEEGSGRSVPSTPIQVSPPAELGDHEEEVEETEEGELEREDGQPSSSNNAPRSVQEPFATVPSISITAPSDRNTPDESRDEAGFGRNQMGAESEEGPGGDMPRTEASVTSSDEDKLDSAGAGSSSNLAGGSQGQSTSRPSSASTEQQLAHRQQQQQRARPTPIVWDQPTSPSSTSSGGTVGSAHGLPRGAHRGSRPVPLLRNMPPTAPEAIPALRGLPFRARGQSARRSRPHGARGRGPPY